MPHTVTESPATFPASVTVPNPGELVLAQDLENVAQPLANRTRHILEGNPNITGDPNFSGDPQFTGTASFLGASGELLCTMHARFDNSVSFEGNPGRSYTNPTPGADQDIAAAQCSVVRVNAATAARNHWVTDPPPADPMATSSETRWIIRITKVAAVAFAINIRIGSAAGAILGTLPNDGNYSWLEVMYTGATHGWKAIGWSNNVTNLTA